MPTHSQPPAMSGKPDSEVAHTPGPWLNQGAEIRSNAGEFPRIICDPYAGQVENEAGTRRRLMPIDEREANAAFIVRACNSHAQLVAALSACLESLKDLSTAYPNDATFSADGYAEDCMKKAEAALEGCK